jgi:ABC-type Na+ efflux pump permease subunit
LKVKIKEYQEYVRTLDVIIIINIVIIIIIINIINITILTFHKTNTIFHKTNSTLTHDIEKSAVVEERAGITCVTYVTPSICS